MKLGMVHLWIVEVGVETTQGQARSAGRVTSARRGPSRARSTNVSIRPAAMRRAGPPRQLRMILDAATQVAA